MERALVTDQDGILLGFRWRADAERLAGAT